MTADASKGDTDTIALMYHALGSGDLEGADPHYTVDMPRFLEQLALCRRIAGAVVSARDWLQGRSGAILTFDDGHESNYRLGFSALVEAGAGADFFVNPAQVGTSGYATWAELREMADAGLSIQSHGLDHRTYLTEIPPARLREDLARARQEIEQHVGQPVTLLAPAGGRAPSNLADVAVEAGYRYVMNSRPGVIRRGQGPTLGRFAVTAKLELRSLEAWLRGGPSRRVAEARYAALDFAKRLLGDQVYERVRRRLLGTANS